VTHADFAAAFQSFALLALGVIGWLIKRQVEGFSKRLDNHDSIITQLVTDVSRLIGINIGVAQRSDARNDKHEAIEREIHEHQQQRREEQQRKDIEIYPKRRFRDGVRHDDD